MAIRSHRSAYTLFEVVLVGAVLTILGAVSYPTLKNMYGAHKLNGAVDSVRAAWAEARSRAIDEGRPYRFSVEPNGTHYRVAPDEAEYWSGSAPANDPNGKGLVLEKALPGGVHFSLGDEAPAASTDASDSGKEDVSKPSGNWSTGTVFLPNGTARDDVKITFQVRGVRPTAIQLRGLTGNVSVQTGTH
jgi:Tfp pilus assembly protein FimT